MEIASLLNGTFAMFFSRSLLPPPPPVPSAAPTHYFGFPFPSSYVPFLQCPSFHVSRALSSLVSARQGVSLQLLSLSPSSPCDSSLALGLSASLILSLSSYLKCHMTHLSLIPGLKWLPRIVSQSLHLCFFCVFYH